MKRKRVLVTGGTRGIGFAAALALKEDGWEVVVTGRGGQKPPAGCGFFSCDFSDMEALRCFADDVSGMKLDALVNNAGITKIGWLSECDPSDFARVQQVNVTAPFLLCRAAVPGMQKRKWGRIVNVTSIFGVVAKSQRSAYAASKFALTGLTKTLALEVARDNVLVNAIAPGVIDTDLTRSVLGENGIAEITNQIPMGRLAKPEEIAHAIRFLVSEKNSYLTGQTLIVDGGYTCA